MRQHRTIVKQVQSSVAEMAVSVMANVTDRSEAQMIFRRAAAVGFYKAFAGYQLKIAKNRVKAIDFRRAIQVEELPVGRLLQQVYGRARGRFYSEVGESASRLGVADYFLHESEGEKQKSVGLFMTTKPITVLKSVAAACEDDWSNAQRPCETCGGGVQFFVPNRDLNRDIQPVEMDQVRRPMLDSTLK